VCSDKADGAEGDNRAHNAEGLGVKAFLLVLRREKPQSHQGEFPHSFAALHIPINCARAVGFPRGKPGRHATALTEYPLDALRRPTRRLRIPSRISGTGCAAR
jgi:hypothetical protein